MTHNMYATLSHLHRGTKKCENGISYDILYYIRHIKEDTRKAGIFCRTTHRTMAG